MESVINDILDKIIIILENVDSDTESGISGIEELPWLEAMMFSH